MSLSFCVKKGKGEKILSVGEILELGNLEQFSFDEGFDEFMESKISEHECVILGRYELTPFGFELWFDKEISSYVVRLTTPATKFDWEVALEFLQILARKNGEKIVDDDKEFTAEEITKINFKSDIKDGITILKNTFKEQDSKELMKFGIIHPMAFSEAIVDEILGAKSDDEVVENYGKFCQNQQFSGGYFAKQEFYQDKNGGIFGAYVLSEGVDTILPFEPRVEFGYTIKDNDVSEYRLILVASVGDDFDSVGEMDYGKFMANLPKDRYKFLDARYIYISAPTNDEICSWAKLNG